MMPVQRPVDNKFDLRNYYDNIRHFACLHEAGTIDHRDFMDTHTALLINKDHNIQIDEQIFTALIHPRWCPACVERRTTVLQQSLARRLANIDLFINNEAVRRNEKAYIQGVFNGRVHALTTRLRKREQQSQFVSTDPASGMNEDADMMSEAPVSDLNNELARVQVTFNGINLSENDQQLAAALDNGMQQLIDKMFNSRLSEGHDLLADLFGQVRTGDSVVERDELHMMLEIELELAQVADRYEKQGFENGRDLQARIERIALNKESVGEREELLEQALL